MAPPCTFRLSRHATITHLQVAGAVDAAFGEQVAKLELEGHLIVDLCGVQSISRDGLRAWASFVRAPPKLVRAVYVVRVPPTVVTAVADPGAFVGAAQVLSVLGVYACGTCQRERLGLLDLRRHASELAQGACPAQDCPVCGDALTSPSTPPFLTELARSFRPSSFERVVDLFLDATCAAVEAIPGALPVKVLREDVCFVRLTGPLRADLNVRRMAAGLDGLAVFDFAGVPNVEPDAAPRLWQMLHLASANAEVLLWRVPAPVLAALEHTRLPKSVGIATLFVACACVRCGQGFATTVKASEVGADASPRTAPCPTCAAPTLVPAVDGVHAWLPQFVRAQFAQARIEALEREATGQALLRAAQPGSIDQKLGAVSELVAHLRATAPEPVLRQLRTVEAMVHDVQRAFEDEQRAHRLVQTLSDVGKVISSGEPLEAVLTLGLEKVVGVLEGTRAFILIKDTRGELVVLARHAPGTRPNQKNTGFSAALADLVIKEARPLVTADALRDPRLKEAATVGGSPTRAVLCAPLVNRELATLGVAYVAGPPHGAMFNERGLAFVESFASQVSSAIDHALLSERSRREERKRERLARYFSEAVLEDIVSGKADAAMAGSSRVVTVLFTDIRESTALLERLEPAQAVELLNDYFTLLTEEVLREKGTIDKFTGDGLMAFWGAPKEQADHAARACRAALAIQARMPELKQRWRAENRSFAPHIQGMVAGIGVHTGEVVVGNIGSRRRMEYTAIGDAVNLAARIQGAASGGEVLLTSATFERVNSDFVCQALPAVSVKGKSRTVPIYRLRSAVDADDRTHPAVTPPRR